MNSFFFEFFFLFFSLIFVSVSFLVRGCALFLYRWLLFEFSAVTLLPPSPSPRHYLTIIEVLSHRGPFFLPSRRLRSIHDILVCVCCSYCLFLVPFSPSSCFLFGCGDTDSRFANQHQQPTNRLTDRPNRLTQPTDPPTDHRTNRLCVHSFVDNLPSNVSLRSL